MSRGTMTSYLARVRSNIFMMGNFVLILTVLFFSLQPATCLETKQTSEKLKLEKFNEKYLGKNWRGFRGGTEVLTSVYDWFLEIDQNKLGKRSRVLYDDVAAIFKSPLDESVWNRYLRDFPREFSEFDKIFCLAYPRELARQPDLFMMFVEDAVHMNPQPGIALVLDLSKAKPAFGDCTAGFRLQRLMANLLCEYDDLTVKEMQKLGQAEQRSVIDFICAVENIEDYQALDCIMKKLNEKNRIALLRSFEGAKKRTMFSPRH